LAVQYDWASLPFSDCAFCGCVTCCDNKLTGSRSMTFLRETEAPGSGGAAGRTQYGFSATGFNGMNCFESAEEFVKGGSRVSTMPPRPKQAPERYSEGCMARSIWSSLLPTFSWEPSSSASGPMLPVVRLWYWSHFLNTK